jgi:nicotinic acid mononucleotide adenylyltransferase
VGVTCSLTKDGERAGRKHNAYIAVQGDDSTYECEVLLKDAVRTRAEQEARVAEAIIGCLAMMCGIPASENCMSHNLICNGTHYGVGQELMDVCRGQLDVTPQCSRENRVIFSGAFNPLHAQHEKIAAKVAELTGQRVDLEVCIKNVDKPALSHAVIHQRRDHLSVAMYQKDWAGSLFWTSTPTFKQKALAFPKSTFVIGWDTFTRLNDPKYGDLDEAVAVFRKMGTKFLVFHRIINGVSSADAPATEWRMAEFAKIISAEELPPVDISSTQIRNAGT